MFFKSKLLKRINKCVLIIFLFLSILDLLFIKEWYSVLTGLVAGGLFSISRYNLLAKAFSRLVSPENPAGTAVRGSILNYLSYLILGVLLLTASLIINQWVFAGVAAGVLLVPSAVFLVCLLHGLGLDRIDFD